MAARRFFNEVSMHYLCQIKPKVSVLVTQTQSMRQVCHYQKDILNSFIKTVFFITNIKTFSDQ